MTRLDEGTITIADESDVILAGRQVKSILEPLEFDESTTEEIVLVVHELASNIVKHAGEGSLTLAPQTAGGEQSIEIHARDAGPGIADVDQAIVDGYSTTGSLGGGLGAVHRLMDDVVINSCDEPEAGVEIVATRGNDQPPTIQRNPPLDVGAATQPKPGQDHNGDAFLIEHKRDQTLVGVIDGLGHGQAAHRASSKAKHYVRTHSTKPLPDLFAGTERACHDTRGVVMLLARLDWNDTTITLGSVGNITLRVCHSPTSPHLTPERGVLGAHAPDPRIKEWDWDPASVTVIHTDGLESHWNCDELPVEDDTSATNTANELLQTLSNREDDATVLVIQGDDR